MIFFIHLQPQNYHAKVAQLVEHDLAKVGVAGPNPVFRSKTETLFRGFFIIQSSHTHTSITPTPTHFAQVVELVDTQDLKSCALTSVRVQVPPRVRRQI